MTMVTTHSETERPRVARELRRPRAEARDRAARGRDGRDAGAPVPRRATCGPQGCPHVAPHPAPAVDPDRACSCSLPSRSRRPSAARPGSSSAHADDRAAALAAGRQIAVNFVTMNAASLRRRHQARPRRVHRRLPEGVRLHPGPAEAGRHRQQDGLDRRAGRGLARVERRRLGEGHRRDRRPDLQRLDPPGREEDVPAPARPREGRRRVEGEHP